MDYSQIKIPAAPRIAKELLTQLEQSEVSFRAIAKTVEFDPGLVASVLRLANSAVYGANAPTSDIAIALGRIGTENIRQICAEHIKNTAFPAETLLKGLEWKSLWEHSALAGIIANRIAKATCEAKRISAIQIGSLFQNIGYFVLGQSEQKLLSYLLGECGNRKTDLVQLEEGLGFDLHESIAQKVLTEWNFPVSATSVARYHESTKRSTLPALSANMLKSVICGATANQLAQRMRPPIPYFPKPYKVPESHWQLLSLSEEKGLQIAHESSRFLQATRV